MAARKKQKNRRGKKTTGRGVNDRHTSCIFVKTEEGDNSVIGSLMEQRQEESFGNNVEKAEVKWGSGGWGWGELMQEA